MDIKWLEDLVVLLEERSFTRAAQRRHVTQPAFSRRVRLLENWLGVEIVDRSTKPVSILPIGLELEENVRDLVNRLYALRNRIQAQAHNRDRISFIAQHTLAMSLFPRLIGSIKAFFPETSYRVEPANNDDCELLFLRGGDFLLGYEAAFRQFDFTHLNVGRLSFGQGHLMPVASQAMFERLGDIENLKIQTIPFLMYQAGGFMADALANTCLPAVQRDYRIEVICESALSGSLKEMVLADMGVAWLSQGLIETELGDGRLVSLEQFFGATDLDIVLYYRKDSKSEQAAQIYQYLLGQSTQV